ncbi:putative serine/threonine-protein kinase SIS8 [Chlorella vulgaris]
MVSSSPHPATLVSHSFKSATDMEQAAGGEQTGLVRLRVSFKGRFTQGEGGSWRYLGGDHFLESLPDTTRYADMMFSLSEKVDGAVSVKYLLPGEELDPDSLISVNDDNDIKELFHEYSRALRMPGTPIKTFRLRVFLFPAAEDPYTPEDLAFYSEASRSSSADKLGRESGGRDSGSQARDSSLTKAFSKVAAATPSSLSSELSSGSAAEREGSPGGTGTPSAADTELAWEAGFLAGQEAAALAAEEEWHELVASRMEYLGQVQSNNLVTAADDAARHWSTPSAGGLPSPWQRSVHEQALAAGTSGGLYGGADFSADLGMSGMDEIDFDPDAEEAAEAAAAETAKARRRKAAAAAGVSHPTSRLPSPRTQALARVRSGSLPPPPLLLHHPQPHLGPAAMPLGSPLAQQTSGVLGDVAGDAEFQSMFESKYEAGAAAAARKSPGMQPGGGASVGTPGSGSQRDGGEQGWGSGRGSGMAADAGAGGSGTLAAAAAALGTPLTSAGTPVKTGAHSGSGSGGGFMSVVLSPKTMLPTHISVFGDGVSRLDLQHAAAVGRPAVELPSHISEFGGEDDGCCDAEMNRDANTMSVMKAALPDDDNLLADALDALRRAPLAPDAVQLPTSFELLGGGPSPRTSPRLEARGMAAAAGGNGGGGGLAEAAGALPHQPGELTRSPSLEALLSKVQRIGVDQVTVLAKIGEGAFGEVSLAQCDTYGRVAVKWIKPTKVERHWSSFWHEAELMSRLNHPNVLRFFGLVVDGPMVVGIMTEFAAAGSLASYLRSGVGFIPLRQRAQLALHAVNGMAYLHSLKVVHFDVKPDNLLVDGDWLSEGGPVCKVADFGLSKHKYNTFCSNVHDLRGTLPYMAPEMIMDHTHVTEKADVWSLGVVFWEMLTLEVPFADMPPAQLIGALGLGKLRLAIPEWCEPGWRALMESCWVEDPTLRPSCRQLATHLERIRDLAR